MANDRLLINYLPHYMREYVEMQEIMNAEQPVIDEMWSQVDNLLSDQFLQDATEIGIMRWESMLGISPKDTDTLELRRFRISARLNQDLPYTLSKLKEVLTELCGVGGFYIALDALNYYIEIRIGLGNHDAYPEVEEQLNKMIPANMITYIKLMFNTHEIISRFTHEQMSVYTHDQLRKEVFEDGE